ncbi:hypothetical protein Cch01nite_32100 [Cellulomonas chitinilytica]|uniref:DUF6318 domain-containing protein n=1 Tax=Cellulomonas chitinilytica TaxID=398759 RepID=A0A919P6G6_9CELL|nr:DUF6318 family protein [Cellulomonas chitinilytica]GIG22486.1 hypothetical protein Cch01nite_32100 [Cellulomonas chitinilytica]
MRIRQGAWGWAALGALALTATGCTGGPPDDPAQSASASPSGPSTAVASPEPTPELTAVQPVPSAEMAQPSAGGAVAAAKYYLELYRYAFATGDLEGFTAMSATDCTFCADVIGDIEQMVLVKHTNPPATIEFARANGIEVVPGQSYGADLEVHQGAWTEVDSTGKVTDRGGPSSVQMYFALGWTDNAWLVRQVDVHDAPTP